MQRSTKQKRQYCEAVAYLCGWYFNYYNPGDCSKYRFNTNGDDYFHDYVYSALSLAEAYTFAVGCFAGYIASAKHDSIETAKAYAFVSTYLRSRSNGATKQSALAEAVKAEAEAS